jgi:hypothetical protein
MSCEPAEEELPESLQLHAALSIACLALELIAGGSLPGKSTAAATLRVLRRDHPVCHEHIAPKDPEP